jgi:hypothetical protein
MDSYTRKVQMAGYRVRVTRSDEMKTFRVRISRGPQNVEFSLVDNIGEYAPPEIWLERLLDTVCSACQEIERRRVDE